MEKILITGGLGYLGRRLVEHLLRDGSFAITVLTRSRAKLETVDGAAVVALDGSWNDCGSEILRGIAQIVHLGGPDEKQSAADPVGAMHEAFAFTHGLMQQAAKSGVKRVLMASTIHVYGAALSGHVTEETVPQPVHPYGIIKRCCEDVVASSSRNGGPPSMIMRLANGFGAPVSSNTSRWSLLVNDLCRQAVEKKRMVLRSDPRTTRNFVTLSDVCGAMAHLLKSKPSNKASVLLHLGSSRSSSIGEMAAMIQLRCQEILGFEPALEMLAPGSNAVPPLDYDLGRLREMGFVPAEDFQAEIDSTLRSCAAWFAGN